MPNRKLLCGLLLSCAITTQAEMPDTVVRCNLNQCPDLPTIPVNLTDHEAIVFETAKDNKQRFRKFSKTFTSSKKYVAHHVTVNANKKINTHPIIGFGGAFTDTAGMLYYHMHPALQKKLIDAYFATNGAEYTLGRVPIASTDFTCRRKDNHGHVVPSLSQCSPQLSLYSYADKGSLSTFALQAEDKLFKIPMIQAAMLARYRAQHDMPFRLYASAWSAPAWMKTNHSMINGRLKPEAAQQYAEYIVKFFAAYQEHHIKFWGMTVQNEPASSTIIAKFIDWQSMFFTPEEEASFIKNHLGPTLAVFAEHYGSKINLIMHDDQITSINARTNILLDPEVAQYIAGAGLHWYLNNAMNYKNLDIAYTNLNTDKNETTRFIIGTEACSGFMPFNKGPSFGNWNRAESYAKDIMQDLSHHVSGWTDWNMLLDMHGGPTWVGNYVDAPILVDLSKQTFYLQPTYYYLAHFSKFMRPGAQMLETSSDGAAPLQAISAHTPAYAGLPETIVIVVLNRNNWSKNYLLIDETGSEPKFLEMVSPARSIQTIVYKK